MKNDGSFISSDAYSSQRLKWAMVCLSFVSMVAASCSENLRSPMYSALVDFFQLSHSMGSLLFWISALCMIVGSTLIGTLFSKSDVIWQHSLGMSLLGVGNLFAFLASSYAAVVAGFALASLGYGMLNITHNVLIEKGASAAQRKRMVFGLHCTYALAAALSPFVYGVFHSYDFGPPHRASLITVGVTLAPLLFGVYLYRLQKRTLKTVIEKVPTQGVPRRLGEHTPFPKEGWLFGFSLGLYVAAEILLCTRLPVMIENLFGWGKSQANSLLGGFLIFFVLGRLLIFVFNPPIDFRKWAKPLVMAASLTVLLGLKFSAYYLVAVGLLISPLFPALVDLAMDEFRERFAFILSRVMVGIGVSLGLMHLFVGYLSDQWGFGAVTVFAAALLALSGLAVHFWSRHFSRL